MKNRYQEIYHSGDPKQGTILIKAAYVEKEPRLKFKFSPKAFFWGGIIGILILFSPLVFMEAKYRLGFLLGRKKIAVQESRTSFSNIIRESDLEILQPVNPQFSLVIPKIDLNSEIFANVEPGIKDQYESFLQKGVAQAKGSYFPGQRGTIYLFGHSTDYLWNINRFNAVFYLLKELEPGDQINIFYQGKRYLYTVTDKKTVLASNLYYLKPKKDHEEVILQTCWPPGTTWQRLLVFAQPVNL